MTHFKVFGERPVLYQWDTGRRVIVLCDCQEVHFSNALDGEALVVATYEEDGTLYANIPNILLQAALPLNVYAYVCAGERYTQRATVLEVNPRSKPADYVYTETEVKNYDALAKLITTLGERLTDLERGDDTKYITDVHIMGTVDSSGNESYELQVDYSDKTTQALPLPSLDDQIKNFIHISDTKPRKAQIGEFWFNTSEKRLYICTDKQPLYDNPVFEPVVPETLQEDTPPEDALSPGNTVMTTPQELTEEQKTQVRENIGAAAKEDLRRDVVVPEQTVVAGEDKYDMYLGQFEGTFDFIMGQKYIVVFNGKEYECIANDQSSSGDISLGNNDLPFGNTFIYDNNEPFAICRRTNGNLYLYVTEAGEYTVAIYMDAFDTLNPSDVVVAGQTIYVSEDDLYYYEEINAYICGYTITPVKGLVSGKEYIVVIDGKKYKCTAYNDGSYIYLGNYELWYDRVDEYSAFYRDEPFLMEYYYSDTDCYMDVCLRTTTGEHTIAMYYYIKPVSPWAPDIVCILGTNDKSVSIIYGGDFDAIKKKCDVDVPVFGLAHRNGRCELIQTSYYSSYNNCIALNLDGGYQIHLYKDGRTDYESYD